MSSHLLLKPLLIFLGGVVFSVVAIYIVTHFDQLLSGKVEESGGVIGKQIERKVEETREGAKKTVIEKLRDRILPAVTESPVLAPIFETTREIENTVNSIKSLPDEQRNAVCRQICGE